MDARLSLTQLKIATNRAAINIAGVSSSELVRHVVASSAKVLVATARDAKHVKILGLPGKHRMCSR